VARRVELWLSAAALVLLLPYWLAWSLLEPVRNVDSQVYNLARLWVIEDGGLFLNRSYTATTQLIMPWSFDAVHYPFVRLGYAYALPSFLCLLGIMSLAFTWARERGDVVDGLRAGLGFLAMPMVVMQATTTKNDIVLAFCLFCWIEALRRHRGEPAPVPAILAALALAFLAGSKLTGIEYAIVAVAVSVWVLRRRPADLAWFAGAFVAALGLIGSWEIFLNNYLQFGDWRGDPLLYRYNSNVDGWRGFFANELRYAASLLDVEILPTALREHFAHLKFEACQALLRALHVEGLGLMSLPWRPLGNANLAHLMATRPPLEFNATFGIVGALVMIVAPVAIVVRRRLDLPAALVLGGAGAQVLIALTLGWHPANHRYFTAAACLGWAGLSLLVVSDRRRWAGLGLTVVAAASALLLPFSAERSPAHLALAAHNRDALLTPFVQEMIERAKIWKQGGELPVVLMAAGGPVFHLYDQLGSNLISIREVSLARLLELDEVHRRGQYWIVVIDTPVPELPGIECEKVVVARRREASICLWRRPSSRADLGQGAEGRPR
jgi:hypothetical protein